MKRFTTALGHLQGYAIDFMQKYKSDFSLNLYLIPVYFGRAYQEDQTTQTTVPCKPSCYIKLSVQEGCEYMWQKLAYSFRLGNLENPRQAQCGVAALLDP